MSARVVVTGGGAISPVGAGTTQLAEALYGGATGIGPSLLFKHGAVTAELRDFRPQQWLGNKGIRTLDRSSRLLCVAAHMALADAELTLESGEEGDPALGLVCGTMFGSVHSIASFDWSGLMEGPNYVNPMEFPNTVINAPAGQAAIKHKLRGVNSTVCAGLASGLHAIEYAADALRFGRARELLAGGVEELCEETVLGFRAIGMASHGHVARPFDPERDGALPGEGAALWVLETEENAVARGVSPSVEICGFGCGQDAPSSGHYQVRAEGATAAIEQALAGAGAAPDRVSCIVACANGNRAGDATEVRALRNVFGDCLDHIPVCAPKAALGESMGASGAFAAMIAGIALERQCLPPTTGFRVSEYGLLLSAAPQPFEGTYALVNAFSCDGNNASMVLRLWKS